MATFADGEGGLSVRTKINNVLQHADGTAGELVINDAGGDVDFRVESDTNANALFVDGATGNTGIGTNFPDAPLRVNGVARATAYQATGQENIVPATGKRVSLHVVSDSYGDLYAYDNTAAASINLIIQRNGGNVGIGTTTPARLFHVNGAIRAGDAAPIEWGGVSASIVGSSSTNTIQISTASAERMRINADGNVGIGTTAPATGYKLDVNGQINISASAAAKLAWGYSGQYLSWIECGGVAGDNYMRFAAANSEAMRITSVATVGIGTISPNAASILDVQSTTKGVRFPNMTTTQKNAIANVAGNVIFDTTLGKLCVNTGSGWQTITSA